MLKFQFFLNFGQIWSNCGQTMVKLLIQEILVLLNNYFSFLNFGQTVAKLLMVNRIDSLLLSAKQQVQTWKLGEIEPES